MSGAAPEKGPVTKPFPSGGPGLGRCPLRRSGALSGRRDFGFGRPCPLTRRSRLAYCWSLCEYPVRDRPRPGPPESAPTFRSALRLAGPRPSRRWWSYVNGGGVVVVEELVGSLGVVGGEGGGPAAATGRQMRTRVLARVANPPHRPQWVTRRPALKLLQPRLPAAPLTNATPRCESDSTSKSVSALNWRRTRSPEQD